MTLALDPLSCPRSPLARLDPRWKLAALGLATVVTAVLQSLPATAAALVGVLLLALWARLPLGGYLARLQAIAPFLVLVAILFPLLDHGRGPVWHLGPVPVYGHGLRTALLISMKAVAIVTLMLVLLATAPLPATLQAAHSLHVPGLMVQLALLTYRYVYLLTGELARLRIALRVRGYRNRATLHSYRTIGHVVGTLLVRSQERAERVNQAMRCRGFRGRFRTLSEFRTTPADLVLFVMVVGMAAGLLAWDVLTG